MFEDIDKVIKPVEAEIGAMAQQYYAARTARQGKRDELLATLQRASRKCEGSELVDREQVRKDIISAKAHSTGLTQLSYRLLNCLKLLHVVCPGFGRRRNGNRKAGGSSESEARQYSVSYVCVSVVF
eukprot:SAG31_NODE_2895_length_4940_cov_4.688494_4_plen_127_part_00